MDLNSTSCTGDDFVCRIHCNVSQCPAGFLKKCRNGRIMSQCYNQGLSGSKVSGWERGERMGLC